MRIANKYFGTVCSVLALASAAVAGDKEDTLIDKVVAAYGGDALISASSMTIEDRYKVLSIGQSSNPDSIDIAVNNVTLTIDYENKRKSVESWNKSRGGAFLNQTIFDGKTGHNYNHLTKTQSENATLDFNTLGGGVMRTSDITLVKLLQDARAEAVHNGDVTYRGKPHETITFKMEGSPDLTLFVDKTTYFVSKMTRQNPQLGELSYNFSAHTKSGGITYAADTNFLIAGQPNIVTVGRHIKINADVSTAFEIPAGYGDQGGTIDTSEMMAKKLADGVYFAGQNGGFSIFVDAGDHYIAAGGYPSLPDRLKAVQELAGNEKPIKEQVITHHHSDHIGGVNEVAELGATFVTVDSHVQTIKDQLTDEIADDRFMRIEGKQLLGGGKVEVYDISTAHADHYLLFYVPSANLIFSADHFGTNLEDGLPTANNNTVTFRQAIDALNLDVDGFVSAHGVRVLTMDDLRTVTQNYTEGSCPAGNRICT